MTPYDYRPLSADEILRLEQNRCTADDWSRVLVARDFSTDTVADAHFHGDIRLGLFRAPHAGPCGMQRPSGVYRATLCNVAVGDDCRIGIIAFTGTRYFDGIDKGFSVMFSKYLAGNSLIALSHDEMGELVAIYGAMHRKLAQPDFRFKREAMLGYMQVLFCCGYQWMLKYREGNAPAGHKPRQQQLFDRFLDLVE